MECVHVCIKATRELGLVVRMAKRISFTASHTQFFFPLRRDNIECVCACALFCVLICGLA